MFEGLAWIFQLFFTGVTEHFFITIWLCLLVFWFLFYKNSKKDNVFLQSKFWFILLDWKFWTWKNRFMVQVQKNSKNYIVLSNFYSGYTNLRWNSLQDLTLLLQDVWKLSEYQNFSLEQLKHYYKDNIEQLNEKVANWHEMKKYKNLPCNWYYTKFLFTCDEFQNLFFNRNSLANFSGNNKILLKLLHQIRHLNSLMIFATQNADELDLKFRRLSTYYINTYDMLNDWLYWYNIYYFSNNLSWWKKEIDDLTKINKTPIFFLNKYKLNNIILKLNIWFLQIKRKYQNFKMIKIKYRFDELDFNSKFNADPDFNTYKENDLFKYLDKFYRNKENRKKMSYDI